MYLENKDVVSPNWKQKVWYAIVNFTQQHFLFIAFMLLVNVPYLYVIFSFGKGIHHFMYMCFFMVCLTCIIKLISNEKIRLTVQRIIAFLSFLLLLVSLYFLYFYHGLPDGAIFEILLATNHHEATEYLQAHLLNFRLYISILVVGFVLLACFLGILKLQRKRSVILFTSVLLIFACIFTMVNIIKDIIKGKDNTEYRLLHNCCSLVSAVTYTCDAINNMKKLKNIEKYGNKHPQLLENKSTIPYVVYIVGESTSLHHTSLYGYHLNTTPYLCALEKSGNLVKFTDVISPNGQTMEVLGKLFTFYRQGAKGNWYEYTDLFSILNIAGYYTTWLSNQEYSGIYGNNGRFYAERCKSFSFSTIRESDSYIEAKYDECLLPLLSQTLKHPKAKNFIVLHLMGTHQEYKKRYPKTFKAFSANVEQGDNEKIKQTKAYYDTAVRYNDSIVNAIINQFKDKNALVIYTSDHGEDVMEINKKVADHGDIDINNNKVEIPMVVYMSPKFQQSYPKLVTRIKQSVHRPFMTDDMIHSILDLMEIRTKEYNPTFSIFNSKYNAKRIRICASKRYPIKP